MHRIARQKSSGFFYRLAVKVCMDAPTLCNCRLDRIVQIKISLAPDVWSDLENQTECLLSLERLIQIRSQAGVGLRTKSDTFSFSSHPMCTHVLWWMTRKKTQKISGIYFIHNKKQHARSRRSRSSCSRRRPSIVKRSVYVVKSSKHFSELYPHS